MSWTTSSSASDRHQQNRHYDVHPALSGRASAQPWNAPRRAHEGGNADDRGAAYHRDGATKRGTTTTKKKSTTTTTTTTSRTSAMRNPGFEIAVGIRPRTSQHAMYGDHHRRRASSGLGFSSSTSSTALPASPFGTRQAVKMARVMGTHDAERVRSDESSRSSPPPKSSSLSRPPLNYHHYHHRSPP